jgi:hypothetical protein
MPKIAKVAHKGRWRPRKGDTRLTHLTVC